MMAGIHLLIKSKLAAEIYKLLMQFLEEIRNAPKDDKGQPNVDATKKGLFWIMFMLFNMSNGKYFSEIKSILIAANS